MARVAFLGPPGTFTEEALLTQPDLASAELVSMRTMPDVLAATSAGDVDYGFVALENAIDGTVNESIDSLVFEHDDLLIQREVVIGVHLNLVGPPGTALADIRRVLSFPKAIAQCRRFLAESLPHAEAVAALSTAEAVREVGEQRPPGTAAVGTALAAKLYGLDVLAEDIEDHPENATRFVLVSRDGVPKPTGHDKTSIVCFQRTDHPGSLHAILGQFSARAINLTKLESRPTKTALGDYCFIIDLEGHVADEVVADCLRDLHASLAGVKFLGSYPAAGEHGAAIRREADEAWRAADEWITALRDRVAR
ncbi:MAG TPA: prephenate dehydratase [Acidimicrobiales bacterium]|nr:prephenate dehydratase [Acidimicrobiales bacterium]